MGRPTPKCPIRPGDACSLCQPGVQGPEDCGLVWLVMNDPELRSRLVELRREVLEPIPAPYADAGRR